MPKVPNLEEEHEALVPLLMTVTCLPNIRLPTYFFDRSSKKLGLVRKLKARRRWSAAVR